METDSNSSILFSKNTEVKLSEISEKDSKWSYFKKPADIMTEIYQKYPEYKKYAVRVGKCANILEFNVTEEENLNFKLSRANFCRVRNCPVCQWRRSLKWKARFYSAIPAIQSQYPTAKFIFLTLTVKNCDIGNLGEELRKMHQGFRNLIRREAFNNAVIGYVRATEVTKPVDSNTKAHPHYHILLMVKSNYFSKNYITQDQWQSMWKECCDLSYDPIVDVRKVKPKKKMNGGDVESDLLAGAVAETLKYAVKPSDLTANADWLIEYTKQTHRKRFIDTGGVLKNVLKENEEETNESMIHIDDNIEKDETDEQVKMKFWWSKPEGDYFNRKPKK